MGKDDRAGISSVIFFIIEKGGNKMKKESVGFLNRDELSILSREELLDVIEQLQKEAAHWKHRFQCADRERELICWQYKIPTV